MQRSMSLIRDKAFVNGEWVSSKLGKTFDVVNPSDGSVIGQVPDMDVQDTQAAIQNAYDAFKPWASTTAKVCMEREERFLFMLTQSLENLLMVVLHFIGKIQSFTEVVQLAGGKQGRIGSYSNHRGW